MKARQPTGFFLSDIIENHFEVFIHSGRGCIFVVIYNRTTNFLMGIKKLLTVFESTHYRLASVLDGSFQHRGYRGKEGKKHYVARICGNLKVEFFIQSNTFLFRAC